MPTQFTSIPRKDLARGIDSYSAKGSIPDGYSEDLQNVDTSAAGQLATRHGYEGYYGWVPLRVSRATMLDTTTLKLEFGDSRVIDLTTIRPGPVVVAGRVSRSRTGNFGIYETTSSASAWYTGFALVASVTYSAGSGTITQLASEHGFTSTDFWVGAAEITSPGTRSNAAVDADDIQIDTTTYAVDLSYTVAADAEGYLFYRDQTPSAGLRYRATVATGTPQTVVAYSTGDSIVYFSADPGLAVGDPVVIQGSGSPGGGGLAKFTTYFVKTVEFGNGVTLSATYGGAMIPITTPGSGTTTVTKWGAQISSATHGLNTLNILARVYDTTTVAGKQVEVDPEDVLIQASTGTVHVIPLDPASTAAFTGVVYLEAVPATQVKAGTATVSGGGPTLNQFTIASPGAAVQFFSVYRYNSVTDQFESVTVDNWAYDATTDTVTVDYYLAGASGEIVEIYWATGVAVSNGITIDNPIAGSVGVDTAPELTVWGIDHADIYRDDTARGGHVTHLDAYKRSGERRLVCGLGGNLYRAVAYSEGANAWSMGSLGASLSGRVSADLGIAPLFWTTNPGAVRTRGVVYDASVVGNKALVTAATYVSAGVTDYTLSFAGKTGSVSLATSDLLTVSGLANEAHTGSWAVLSVQSDSATQSVIRVSHPSARPSLDEVGAMGRAGVFTDQITLQTMPAWLAGDAVIGGALPAAGLPFLRFGSPTTTVVVSGVTSALQLASGERIGVRRTTYMVPLADTSNVRKVDGFVSGDMVVVGGPGALDRRPRVLSAQPQIGGTVTLSGDATLATVACTVAHRLSAGSRVQLYGGLSGSFIVTSTPTVFNFTVVGADVASVSGQVYQLGKVVELDEAITIEDSPAGQTTLTVDGRWIPLEAPYTAATLPADTYYRYLDAGTLVNQAALRSAIIQDSMYFTNAADEVFKFDGTYLTRAGLPRWQPGLFATNDTAATSTLAVGASVAFSSKSTSGLYFVSSTAAFAPGDYIYEATAKKVWLVDKVVTVPGTATVADSYQITVVPGADISMAAASGTLYKVLQYKYYFKFNLIDRNQLIVASYAAQSEDFGVEYTSAGQLKLRLVGPPAFGPYDFDRIELEVYRTEGDGALFYLQSRRAVDFTTTAGYIDIVDSTSDLALAPGVGAAHGAVNRDSVMSRLLGNELGTGWDQPPRAGCVTTLDNRLILGNITGYPESNITFRAAPGQAGLPDTALNGKIVTLRKDADSVATVTDMTNVVRLEFRTTGASFTFVDADVNTGTEVITHAAHGMVTGQAIQLSNSGGALPGGLSPATTYYVISASSSTFKLATTAANAHAGTPINISSAAGGGTHTLTQTSGVGITPSAITRTATTMVVTSTSHGLVAGNWVYIFQSTPAPGNLLQAAGWWQIASVTTNTFTINVTNTFSFGATDCDRYVTATTKTDVPVWLGVDGNYNFRDGNAASQADVTIQAPARLAAAINAAQRVTTVSLGGQAWLTASAGQDRGTGSLQLVSPLVVDTTPGLAIGTLSSSDSFRVYVDGVDFAVNSYAKSFISKTFPARLVRSYANFPDVFDNPLATAAIDSDSIIDVNPADGQAITAIIPFFGQSTGASSPGLAAQILVVIKEQSVYLVNVETREVTKINTRGMGGTAPRAVCQTQAGIVFVNESGVYRLNIDQSISTIGLFMSGKVRDHLNKAQIAEAHAHHWAQGRRVKVSVPVDNADFPEEVWVYDYEREGKGQEFGAWTRYTNHPACGWANLGADAYWASQHGDVFLVRARGDASDYRDEAAPVAEAIITPKSEDFGLPGVRKVFSNVTTELELPQTDVTGLTIETATNLSRTFASEGAVTLRVADLQQVTFRTSLDQRRGTRLQVRYRHQAKDEALVLTGIAYAVGSLGTKLVPEQADQT